MQYYGRFNKNDAKYGKLIKKQERTDPGQI